MLRTRTQLGSTSLAFTVDFRLTNTTDWPAVVTERVTSSPSSSSSFFSTDAPGQLACTTMVLMVKLGSSSRPSFT
jgi:hypothetical protein